MKILRFDVDVGKPIDRFGSHHLVMSRLVYAPSETRVGCMYLAPGGKVGYHRAVGQQLFVVVQGEGWVRSEVPEAVPIHAGLAAYWAAGEWHAAGTGTGMVAMVIEGELLNYADLMPEA